jgi:hypothetical protein
VAAAGLGAAQPAHAEPTFPLFWGNVTGETVMAKPKVTVTIPKSTFAATVDLGNGQLVGDMKVPDMTMKMKMFGFVPVTSIVRMVPVGQTTGTVDLANSKVTSTTRFTLEVLRSSTDFAPDINMVQAGCTTSAPSEAVLVNTAPIDLGGKTPLTGTFTVPKFKNCGILTPLLTHLISGPGNTMSITLSN